MTVTSSGFLGQVISAAKARTPWLRLRVSPSAAKTLIGAGARAADERLLGWRPKAQRARDRGQPADEKPVTPRLSHLAGLPGGSLDRIGDLARVLSLPAGAETKAVDERIDTQIEAERAALRAAVPRLRELTELQALRRRQDVARKEIEIAHLERVRAVAAQVQATAAERLAATEPGALIPRRPYLNLIALAGATAITAGAFFPIVTSVSPTFAPWLSWATVAGFGGAAVAVAHAAGVLLRKKSPVWQPALLLLVWTVLGANAVTTLQVTGGTMVLAMNFLSLYLAGGVIALLTAYTRYNPAQAAHRLITKRVDGLDLQLSRAQADLGAVELEAGRLSGSSNDVAFQLEVLEGQRVALYDALRAHLRLGVTG
jgi:hypothetical protein